MKTPCANPHTRAPGSGPTTHRRGGGGGDLEISKTYNESDKRQTALDKAQMTSQFLQVIFRSGQQ